MSWQAYVDTSLVGTGDVDQAAIISAAGDSVWATSAGFTVTPAEMQEIVTSFSDQNMPKAIQSTGVHVAGQKYFVLKADDRSIYGKQGRTGIIIVKTKMAMIVAHYPGTVQPGAATITVEKLGDYLISVGY